ncbi:hypothetical protein FJZ18_00745 [Candidatus Pacearchaeota archaeon]|nr:hypothetical protein [Candidatus Pacearchaeota archaeon]
MDRVDKERDREKLLLNIVFFRFFNRRGIYEDLKIKILDKIDESCKNRMIESFSKMQQQGKIILNDAYLISSGDKGTKKHESIINNLQVTNWQALISRIDIAKTPEESLHVLQSIPMVGPFLACEIWTDLSYLKFFKQGWTDNDFVNIGPGAKWGLEILAGKSINQKEQYIYVKELD